MITESTYLLKDCSFKLVSNEHFYEILRQN